MRVSQSVTPNTLMKARRGVHKVGQPFTMLHGQRSSKYHWLNILED